MIDMTYLQEKVEMKKNKELLSKHPYKIWCGKNCKWMTYLPDSDKKDGRRLIKRNTEKEIVNIIIDYWRQIESEELSTIHSIFYEWIDSKIEYGEISKSTYDRYIQDFNRFYSGIAQNKISTVTEYDLEDFLLRTISKHNLSSKSFCNLKVITVGTFKKAKRKNLISFNVISTIQNMEISKRSFKRKIKEDYQEVFSENELPKVEQYLKNNLDIINLGILLMFNTGLRVGELSALKKVDIDKNVIKIRRTETRYYNDEGKMVYEVKDFPKTEAGIRNVVIPDSCMYIIKQINRLNPFGEYLFEKGGHRVKTYSIRKRLYAVCEAVGIYKKSPHKIRKTYGSILLDNNVDKKLIVEQMGHTDIACTENFYHINRKNIDKKASILSNIPEFCAK